MEGKTTNGFRQTKALTKKQLENKLLEIQKDRDENYIPKSEIFETIIKGDNFKSIYFADRGIGIYICKDYVLSTTNFHQHVWNKIDSKGYNQTCIFLEMLVDISLEHINDIKADNERGEVYYSLDKLMGLNGLTDSEKIIIQMTESWFYILNENIHSLNCQNGSYGLNKIKYFSWHAFANSFFFEENRDVMYYEFIDKFLSNQAFLFSGNNIDKDKEEETIKQCDDIMKKALSDIRELNIKNGSKLSDFVLIPKDKKDEAESLNELQH